MTQPRAAILFNSSTGSNTAASGLGPATAITGSNAAHTNGAASTTITLTNTPDLSGVQAGDMLWINSTRKFSVISAVDNGAKTVTVDDSFNIASGSAVSYAIGGKRLSLAGSSTLYASGGDIKAGWILEMESAYTETFASRLDYYPLGDTTNGPVILRGASGVGTKPVLTFNNCDFVTRNKYNVLKDFSLVGTGGATTCFVDIGGFYRYEGLTISGFSGELIGRGGSGVDSSQIIGCHLTGGSVPIRVTQNCFVAFNRIINPTSHGISAPSANLSGLTILQNYISGAGGDGINVNQGRTDMFAAVRIAQNRIYNCTGNGIEYGGDNDGLAGLSCLLNILVDNGGYGIEFVSITANKILARMPFLYGNAFYSNTSGEVSPSGVGENHITLSGDPFVDAASGDFNINNTAGAGATLRGTTRTVAA
jgi:hypothetical protein